jgi:hypothetical protein
MFKNDDTVQDGRFSTFYFQKITLNQRVIIFPFCKLLCVRKYSHLMEKIVVTRYISKMLAKNQDGVIKKKYLANF